MSRFVDPKTVVPEMILGIDASRCRSGGSINHLKGILQNVSPGHYGIREVHCWAYSELLQALPDFDWLVKHQTGLLDRSLLFQLIWQKFFLRGSLIRNNIDVLFTADASTLCSFDNQVVLSQDLLAYEPGVVETFGFGMGRLRLTLIRYIQNRAFRAAAGVMFLTQYSASLIQKSCGDLNKVAIVPHGVNEDFRSLAVIRRASSSVHRRVTCTYVSTVEMYKHQWVVVRAVALLKSKGFDIYLNLIGGGHGRADRILTSQILESDPSGIFITQDNFINHAHLREKLRETDIFVFASSCETFGITLLEGMAAGLPIACSSRSSLPEVLGEGGLYFNPEDEVSISDAIESLICNPELANSLGRRARAISEKFSWDKCADDTFTFILECHNEFVQKSSDSLGRHQS
jgi:glycosyltransferase involved in cell wall biosynthesis